MNRSLSRLRACEASNPADLFLLHLWNINSFQNDNSSSLPEQWKSPARKSWPGWARRLLTSSAFSDCSATLPHWVFSVMRSWNMLHGTCALLNWGTLMFSFLSTIKGCWILEIVVISWNFDKQYHLTIFHSFWCSGKLIPRFNSRTSRTWMFNY